METDSAIEKMTGDGCHDGRVETARPPFQRRHFTDYRVDPFTPLYLYPLYLWMPPTP